MQEIDVQRGGLPLNLDTTALKLIAIVIMTIDHVGLVLVNNNTYFRMVGRLAFPLFVYCVVVGCVYTRNFWRYAGRMAMFAIIAQPIYMFCFDGSLTQLNIFPTLLAGMLLVYCLQKRTYLSVLGAIALMLYAIRPLPLPIPMFDFSQGFAVEFKMMQFPLQYGYWGLGLFLMMYVARHDRMTFLATMGTYILLWGATGWGINVLGFRADIQLLAIFAVPLMAFPMHTGLKMPKYLFYAFYPGHMIALWLISQMMQ